MFRKSKIALVAGIGAVVWTITLVPPLARDLSRPSHVAASASVPEDVPKPPELSQPANTAHPSVVARRPASKAVTEPIRSSGEPTSSARPSGPHTTAEAQEFLGQRFAADAVDTSWSREASSIAKTLFTTHLPEHSEIVDVACRSSLCRIETKHPDVEEYRRYLESALTSTDQRWDGAQFISLLAGTPPGQITGVAYLARSGSEMFPEDAHP